MNLGSSCNNMHVFCRRKGATLQLFSDLSSGYLLLISVNLLTFQGYSNFSKEVLMNIYRCYRLWKTRFSRPKNRKKGCKTHAFTSWNPAYQEVKPSISGGESMGFTTHHPFFHRFFRVEWGDEPCNILWYRQLHVLCV